MFLPYHKGSLIRGRILLHAQWSAEMRNQWDSIWLFGTITSRTINILFTQSLRCLFIIVHGTPSTYTLRFCASLSWFDRATAPLHLYILGSKFPSRATCVIIVKECSRLYFFCKKLQKYLLFIIWEYGF